MVLTRKKIRWTPVLLAFLLVLAAGAAAQQKTVVLSLDDAVQQALEKNRSVLKADQDIVAANAAVTEYKADAWPQLTFNAEWKHNILRPKEEIDLGLDAFAPLFAQLGITGMDMGPSEIDLVPPDEFTFNVGLTQNIYTFGRLYNAIKLAKAYVDVAESARSVTRQDVRLEVTSAYYQVLFARELVEVARAALDQAEKTRDNLQEKYEQGLASEYDYLRARVEAANRRPAYLRAKTGVTLAEKNLKRLIGLPLNTPITTTTGYREERVSPALDDSLQEALSSRTELVLLDQQAEASQREYGIYRSNMLPSISGFSDYTWTGSEQVGFGGDGELSWYNFWTAGLRVYVPIFDGLRNWGRMQQAKAEKVKAELDRMEAEDLIRLEVENHQTQLLTLQEEFVALGEAVRFAERTVTLAELRFENGLGTQLDVVDAQTALVFARNNLAEARYNYNVELAAFERALGRYAIEDEGNGK